MMSPYSYLLNTLQIKQLQVNLQQEKSVRVMLEKAIGRASSTLSPGHRHFATQVLQMWSSYCPHIFDPSYWISWMFLGVVM